MRNVFSRIGRAALIAGIGLAGLPTLAPAQDLVYDFEVTRACVAAAEPGAAGACIGRAAEACMAATEGGESTYGMGACLDAEWQDWDAWLNGIYPDLMAQSAAFDAEAQEIGIPQAALAEALRDMQRAWIGFRDAACAYEAAQWGSGTGAGPAATGCLMRRTGEQVLFLLDQVMPD